MDDSPFANLIQCIEDIQHNESTQFEWPEKMPQANGNDQIFFFIQIITIV